MQSMLSVSPPGLLINHVPPSSQALLTTRLQKAAGGQPEGVGVLGTHCHRASGRQGQGIPPSVLSTTGATSYMRRLSFQLIKME